MRMKPVDPAAVIRDPHTKQPLPAKGGDVPENNFWTRRWLAGEVWRLEGDQWVRRAPDGSLVREVAERDPDEVEDTTGEHTPASSPPASAVLNAPVAPLTTR